MITMITMIMNMIGMIMIIQHHHDNDHDQYDCDHQLQV